MVVKVRLASIPHNHVCFSQVISLKIGSKVFSRRASEPPALAPLLQNALKINQSNHEAHYSMGNDKGQR